MPSDSAEVSIVDLDPDSLAMMSLNGRVCFNCPLLENPGAPASGPSWCRVSSEDLLRLVRDERSGVKMALHEKRIVGYAVFGRPALFRNLDLLPVQVDSDALLIGALYATPMAEAAGVDADLLVEIMGFARDSGYEVVQAACRPDDTEGPEGPSRLFSAAGFEVSDTVNGRCLARTTVEEWNEAEEEPG